MTDHALYFWSKKASSSLYFKSIIIEYKLNINIISVDNSTVRELITKSKYPIKNIPSLLIIKDNDFRLYSGETLKLWFDKFFQTIEQDGGHQFSELSQTPEERAPIKPVMNRQQLSQNYRSTLASPGIEFNGNSSITLIPETEEMSNNDSNIFSKMVMANKGIGKPPKQTFENNDAEEAEEEAAEEEAASIRPIKLKTNSISAVELADKLKTQREEIEQELEDQRPFD